MTAKRRPKHHRNSASVYSRVPDPKPCPTCYAPLRRVRGGWICEGFGAHRFDGKVAA